MERTSVSSRMLFLFVLSVVGLSTHAFAQQVEQFTDYMPDYMPVPFAVRSATAPYTGITIASITVSPEIAGVPCFNCVPDAGGHVALPFPWHIAPAGESNWSTVIVFDSVLPEGAGGCSLSMSWFHLASQEVIHGPRTSNFDNCTQGMLGAVNFMGITVPNKLGDVMVIGTVKSENGTQASSSELIKITEGR